MIWDRSDTQWSCPTTEVHRGNIKTLFGATLPSHTATPGSTPIRRTQEATEI